MNRKDEKNKEKIEIVNAPLHGAKKGAEAIKNLVTKKENPVEQTLGMGLPEKNKDLIGVSNVVDLSVTGLKTNDLKNIWNTLKTYENLTSLGVTMTQKSSIALQECRVDKLKKLKRLRMEAHQFSIGSTSAQPKSLLENLGFQRLIDLTLTSHKTIDIKIESGLPKLERLRLNGVRKGRFCRIEIQGSKNLRKLVIGEMEMVAKVEICRAVIKTVRTLKLHNLPELEAVVYSDQPKSLLRWERSNEKQCDQTINLEKTIILKEIKSFPHDHIRGLRIHHY